MQSHDSQIASLPASSSWPRRLGVAAVGAAFALAVLLGVRNMGDYDIGYHLAYGEHFLQTGRIVQTNQFIYTHFNPAILADPANLGPGNTYEPATNSYHFVNANWLSQVVMALVYRVGGVNGLIVFQAALVAGMFALLLAVMRQAGVGWAAAAAAMLLAAMVSYKRFNLRPELLGYVILLAQWLLLSRRQFALRHAAGVILLQTVLVNMHSYFLPSIALGGAMLADCLLRMAWARRVTRTPIEPERKMQAKWLGVAVAGMAVACLVNPWTWRGAIFPIQTLAYLNAHHIIGQEATTGTHHPWAAISELLSPFAPRFAGMVSTQAYFVMLALAGVAAAVGLLRRRWGLLLAMGGMLLLSLSAQRNMALSAVIVIPCAAAIGQEAWRWLADRLAQRRGRDPLPVKPLWAAWAAAVASVALLAAGVVLSAWTVTNGLYFHDGLSWRFATGWARTTVPVSAADWISRNNPSGRVFTDEPSCSNLMFLTQPHRDVPLLTNTWAFPPYVKEMMTNLDMGKLDFDSQIARWQVQTVVLYDSSVSGPLIRHLADSKDWAVVDLDVAHVTFVRRNGPNATLALVSEIRPDSRKVDLFAAKAASADAVPAFALHKAASILGRLGWDGPSLALCERCVAMRADYAEPRNMLGIALAERGAATFRKMQEASRANRIAESQELKAQGIADWERARGLFKEAIRLKSDYAEARSNLAVMDSRLAYFLGGQDRAPYP